ncbi:cyclin-dependent kinase G-1 [Stachybotrys elegans]|uniref:cyclin-dependent kinase n=1 Tax=Stachybotrys elegans TaxID=80388 RepID=A0A8K0SLH8_9HYPO|nr:cyclin-dependent kinase G-1 [Stachybotrys elegans]
MASKPKSRWADTEADAELDAKLEKEKQEKRRKKAEKARRLEEEKKQAAATLAASRQQDDNDDDDRPSKRRKVTPEPGAASNGAKDAAPRKLLRYESRGWDKSRSVENYERLNDIEEGAYGLVVRARQKSTGKVVALKQLKLTPGDAEGVPVTGLREIQILRACSHKNVVGLEEIVVGDNVSKMNNSIFLVLEFLEHDLRTILEDISEPFLSSEVKQLLLQLTSGVAYLHENWILHRDLKTSNILLNNRGRLKIADFGMARYVGDPPPKLTRVVVTLWYRAPEVIMGAKEYGSAIDMWSVGCIFGELMTCEPLLQGDNEAAQIHKIFELCGTPTEESWPGFRKLPNARSLRLPRTTTATGSVVRTKFSTLTSAGVALLDSLLALNPKRRPSAKEMLNHEYFRQDPKPKPESLFPTFPSKAGQEKRRRHEPHAPVRGQAAALGDVDFSGIFQDRDKEQRGAGFSLRMG